jgi:hypothetical protein
MNGRYVFGRRAVLMAVVIAAAIVAPVARAASSGAELKFGPTGHARIPFDAGRPTIWVRGTVNGSDSLWIVIDTGASAAGLDLGVARRLSLELKGTGTAQGSGGAQQTQTARNVTIQLPGLSIKRSQIPAYDLAAISAQSGRPLQVIVGYELFESCVVRVDYAAGTMDVWERGKAPKDLEGTPVPMRVQGNHPYIEGTLAIPGRPPLRGEFQLDTGNSGGLVLDAAVVRQDSLISAFPRTLGNVSRGVGGETKSRIGRATSFTLGELSFTAPTVMLPEPTAGRFNASGTTGNMGGRFLERCIVTFDYANKKIWFAKNAKFDQPFEADMSGAALTRSTKGFEVRAVAPDSPASEAGVAVGDIVNAIDDQALLTLDPFQVRQMLQREGAQVTFDVTRGTEKKQLKLTLRRLI